MTAEPRRPLLSRFPALRRLHARLNRRRIPEVMQMSMTDCGPACLAMVLGLYGRHVTLDQVREVTTVSRSGLTALSMMTAGRHFGLRGRGVSLDVDKLQFLPRGAILHWRFNHYVVFEQLGKDFVEVIDPAHGRRHVSMETFRKCFTGVVLLFEPGEGFQQSPEAPRGSARFLVPLMRQSGTLGRIFVLSLLLQFFTLSIPLLTGMVVDRVIPRGDGALLAVISVGMASLTLFYFLSSLVRGYLLTELRTRVDAEMTLGFLEHLVSLAFSFFQSRPVGDLMNRLSMNSVVRDLLSTGALSTLLDGTLVLVYLGILLAVEPLIGLLVLGLGTLQVLIFVLSRQRQRRLMTQNLEQEARNQSYQIELLTGIQTLKAFGAEDRALQNYSHLFVNALNIAMARGKLGAWMDAATSTLRLASPLLLLCLGARQVLQGGLSTGQMLGLNALATAVLVPLSNLVSTGGQFLLLSSYLERISDVMDTPPERPRSTQGQSIKLSGVCELEHVSFRYERFGPLIIQDVSIRIPPGKMVAIVGPSGAGKSTLANLLLGLYLPSSGRVLYDGQDLGELDLHSVRGQMGVVLQEPAFFSATIRANITLNDADVPLEVVMEAARQAHVHDDIMAFPLKYDTPLSTGGQGLSGGQRQRLGLARALVRNPAMLLLDEATSALDAVTEAKVHDSLSALQCTRVVIAHRLSTVVNADLILVMDEGKLVEQGTHAELMERGGVYSRLIEAQLRGQKQHPPSPERAAS